MQADSVSSADKSATAQISFTGSSNPTITRSDATVLHESGLHSTEVDIREATAHMAISDTAGKMPLVVHTDQLLEALAADVLQDMVDGIEHQIALPHDASGQAIPIKAFATQVSFFDAVTVLLNDYLPRQEEHSPAADEFSKRVALHDRRMAIQSGLDAYVTNNLPPSFLTSRP